MKKLAATLFFILVFGVTVFSQAPSLNITCETAGLPCDLFYGSVKVKPVRLRPPGTASTFWCVGAPNSAITITDCDFFIQQQYIDFLKRFPEAGPDGIYGTSDDPLFFYMNIIKGCNPADNECIKYTRGAVSANFFRSPEFNGKGAYVANLYNITVGQRAKTAAELSDPSKVERPHYGEFIADLAAISTPNDDPTLTNQLKDQLSVNFLNRSEIAAIFAGTTNTQYVQKLEQIAGVTVSNESTLISNLNGGTMTRAQVLRNVAENSQVADKFYKPNFVAMEYLGYLRRDPEDCHNQANWGGGDPNNCGFIFHNNRFNLSSNTDLIQNIIVRGFIESPEYINRF